MKQPTMRLIPALQLTLSNSTTAAIRGSNSNIRRLRRIQHKLLRHFDPLLRQEPPSTNTMCVRRRTATQACSSNIGGTPPPPSRPMPVPLHTFLEGLNESTKWTVSLVVFGILAARRDVLSAWCVTGSVLAAILCRVLKFAINESRPPSARKKDPGMPSAHANSLGFLSTFVSFSTVWAGIGGDSVGSSSLSGVPYVFLVFGVPLIGMFLAWLRIALQYHTKAQVIVGWLVGSGVAAWWNQLGYTAILPFLQAHPELAWRLYGVTALAVAAFVVENGKRWISELLERRVASL